MEGGLFADHREDIDETTARIQQRYAEKTRAQRDVQRTIAKLYRDVWQEFYDWEPEGCQQIIDSLAPPTLSKSMPDDPIWDAGGGDDSDMDIDEADLELSFTVWHVDQHHTMTTTCSEFQVEEIVPHPKYESCTPSGRNVKVTDSPHFLQFFQYAGEPGFDIVKHSKMYDIGFAWQTEFHDPDARLIAFETARRLKDRESLSYEDIDQHGILPRLLGDGDEGLLFFVKQRDPLLWPGSTLTEEGIFAQWDYHDPAPQSLSAQINKHVDLLCPNLNCVEAICMTHKFHPPPLKPALAIISSTQMMSQGQQHCGPECYLALTEDNMDIIAFEESELEMLDGILKLFPDVLPCSLAYLCKVSCYKIYLDRCFLFRDEDIAANVMMRETGKNLSQFADGDYHTFTPVDFCCHVGPCDKHSGCPCFENSEHCKRSCRCSRKCKLRHKGCKCRQNKCVRDVCICLQGGRECDPEVCGLKMSKAKARRVVAPDLRKHQCPNMRTQHAEHFQLEVKTGLYGLGAFAVQTIPKGKQIGEYISECTSTDGGGPGALHSHRGLNYLFDLNPKWTLDAAFLGNETRYINDPLNTADANVVADVMYVNGEHRIALKSRKNIKAGSELLLSYGENYWKHHT